MTSLVQGTGASAKMARSLKPGPRDFIVLKPMHSAFFGTPLDMLVDRIGVRSIVMADLATDMCIQISAADAFLRGLKICVPEDCTAVETAEKKAFALRYMRSLLMCDTRPWDRLQWTR